MSVQEAYAPGQTREPFLLPASMGQAPGFRSPGLASGPGSEGGALASHLEGSPSGSLGPRTRSAASMRDCPWSASRVSFTRSPCDATGGPCRERRGGSRQPRSTQWLACSNVDGAPFSSQGQKMPREGAETRRGHNA